MLCLTPLLRCLDKISFWGWDSKKGDPKLKWSMYFEQKELQRSKFRRNQIGKGFRSPIRGTVIVTTLPFEKSYQELRYAGYEVELSSELFQEMKEDRDWPTTMDLETSSDVP